MNIENESKIYAYAIFIAIMVGILAGTGFLKGQTQNKKTANLSCEELCKYETMKAETDYLGASKAEMQYPWKYYLDLNDSPEKTFETQKQCIDYCSSEQ
jgi:hypothetical protein